MKQFFYLASLRRSIIQMLDVFNDINIAKYDDSGNVLKYVEVPLKYAPKQKYYSWVYDRKYEKRLPMMGMEMTSIEYSANRESGRYDKIPITIGDSDTTFFQNGVPYDISFSLHVATDHLSEMDQITEQILPFFNPHVMTKVSLEGVDLTWDMKITLESASIEQDANIEKDALRKIHWTFTFKAETFLFKALDTVKTILKVTNKYYLSDESFALIDTTTDTVSGGGSEDVEGLVIGWKNVDDEILTRYEQFD